MKTKTKLIRNLKRGDKIQVSREDGLTAIVTVSAVQETRAGYATGKRRWVVIGNFPYWWPIGGLTGYSTDRIELV